MNPGLIALTILSLIGFAYVWISSSPSKQNMPTETMRADKVLAVMNEGIKRGIETRIYKSFNDITVVIFYHGNAAIEAILTDARMSLIHDPDRQDVEGTQDYVSDATLADLTTRLNQWISC